MQVVSNMKCQNLFSGKINKYFYIVVDWFFLSRVLSVKGKGAGEGNKWLKCHEPLTWIKQHFRYLMFPRFNVKLRISHTM